MCINGASAFYGVDINYVALSPPQPPHHSISLQSVFVKATTRHHSHCNHNMSPTTTICHCLNHKNHSPYSTLSTTTTLHNSSHSVTTTTTRQSSLHSTPPQPKGSGLLTLHCSYHTTTTVYSVPSSPLSRLKNIAFLWWWTIMVGLRRPAVPSP